MVINRPSLPINPAFKTAPVQTFASQARAESPDSSDRQRDAQESSLNKSEETQQQISEQKELQQLKNLDREVRAHEMAHLSVAGKYATSGASFSFRKGPDGRLYAVAGEVGIDTSAIPGDPQATLRKAQAILRAALAPADPSPQDHQVAAKANAMAQQARLEIVSQQDNQAAAKKGENLDIFA